MKNINDINKMIFSLTEAQWKELYLEHARGNRTDIVPFPTEDIQVITNGQRGEITAKGAISILDCVMSCISEVYAPSIEFKDMHILDYGCGWGRITRLLPFYFNTEKITGADVDDRLINSANELLPFIEHYKIESMEVLPFKDACFDVVFANSVFSHLSKKSALFTLNELSRILKKQGVLIISVLEQTDMNKFYTNEKQRDWITKILGQQEEATSILKKDGFVWGDTRRWHEYGVAIVSDHWVVNNFEEIGIEYRGTKRGTHRGSQNYKFGVKLADIKNQKAVWKNE